MKKGSPTARVSQRPAKAVTLKVAGKSQKVSTNSGLAKALGVSEQTVYRMKKHPAWRFRPPYQVKRVRAWRAKYLHPDQSVRGNGSPDLAKASSELKAEKLGLLKLQNQIDSGELVPVAAFEASTCRLIKGLSRELDNMVKGMPVLLAGNNEETVRAILRERIDQAKANADRLLQNAIVETNPEKRNSVASDGQDR